MSDYITRAFRVCPPERHDALNEDLRDFCREIAAKNEVHTLDWANLPLPPICFGKRKAKLLQQGALSSSLLSSSSSSSSSAKTNLTSSRGSSPTLVTSHSSTTSGRRGKKRWVMLTEEDEEEEARKLRRARRFQDVLSDVPSPSLTSGLGANGDPNKLAPVVGTCQDLEKQYFRLTSAPLPSAVRPPMVLARSLDHLERKAQENIRSDQGVGYTWLCDQYKSVRQDLTVQHIRTPLTVRAYEAHGRLALQYGDLGEFNQCQTQLRTLYAQGIPGCEAEFTGYMLLYLIYTQNDSGLVRLLARLNAPKCEEGMVDWVGHALEVREAVARGDWITLRQLRSQAPGMGGVLMDKFADRECVGALSVMTKAFRAPIPLTRLSKLLVGPSAQAGEEGIREFIESHGGASHLIPIEAEVAPVGEKKGKQRRKKKSSSKRKAPASSMQLETFPSLSVWQSARGKFSRVDIKGQV